jgi:hypothetical protein
MPNETNAAKLIADMLGYKAINLLIRIGFTNALFNISARYRVFCKHILQFNHLNTATFMEKYLNFTGESTITHYEIGDDYIILKYKKDLSEYTVSRNSKKHIDEMKVLAKKGNGLSRYITKHKIKEEGASEETTVYQKMKSIFSLK